MSPPHAPSIFYPRLLFWTFVLTTVLFPQLYQPIFSTIWRYLYNSPFYRLSTFETILTVFSYAAIELHYTFKFVLHPELRIDVRDRAVTATATAKATSHSEDEAKVGAKKLSKRPPGPKLPRLTPVSDRLGEILVYIAPLLLMDLTMIKKFAGVPLNDIRTSGGYAALPTTNKFEDMLNSAGYSDILNTTQDSATGAIHASFLLPTLHNFTLTSPLQLTRALPFDAPSSRRLTLELLISLILYDTLFFLLHLSLHSIPLLTQFHLPHHTHQEIHPQITNRLSVPERLSLVLVANFSLNVIGAHVLTRTLFVPVFVDLLVQVHCGMELPWGYERFLPEGWGMGCREHARHHRTGRSGYAPFFGWWDWGLEWARGRRKRRGKVGRGGEISVDWTERRS